MYLLGNENTKLGNCTPFCSRDFKLYLRRNNWENEEKYLCSTLTDFMKVRYMYVSLSCILLELFAIYFHYLLWKPHVWLEEKHISITRENRVKRLIKYT